MLFVYSTGRSNAVPFPYSVAMGTMQIMQFSLRRKASERVPCTQREDDDFEEDSTASQYSRMPCKRAWCLIQIKYHADCTKEEAMDAFAEYHDAEFARAGSRDDVRPGNDDLGGFKNAIFGYCLVLAFLFFRCTTASDAALLPEQDYNSKARAQLD